VVFGLLTPALAQTSSLELGPGSILVYENQPVTKDPTSLVIRIARFQPDIVFEWETVSFQGTGHIFRAAVRSSRKINLSAMFDPGVDMEASDWTVKWLSRALYEDLIRDGKAKIELNGGQATFEVTGKGLFTLTVDGEEVTLPAFSVKDSRRASWTFLDDPSNPLFLQYETRYYHEQLKRVATDQKGSLRWIKKLPPVK
jgi:hypothetical protein